MVFYLRFEVKAIYLTMHKKSETRTTGKNRRFLISKWRVSWVVQSQSICHWKVFTHSGVFRPRMRVQ